MALTKGLDLKADLAIEVDALTESDHDMAVIAVTLFIDRDYSRASLRQALTVLFAKHRENVLAEYVLSPEEKR